MTVSTQAASVTLEGNGATTVFNYSFNIPYQADGVTPAVAVSVQSSLGEVTVLTPMQFSISGVGNPAGGTVTYPLAGTPIPTGASITISRALDAIQPFSFPNQSFLPRSVEQLADYLIWLIQQAQGGNSRALKLPWGEVPIDLPSESLRAAGDSVFWDADRVPYWGQPAGVGATSYMAGLLTSVSRAQFIASAGIQSRLSYDVALMTGYSAADATVAVNAAVALASLLPSGGNIRFSESCTVKDTIEIVSNGICIESDPMIVITFDTDTDDCIFFNGATNPSGSLYNCTLRNLFFTHPAGKTGGVTVRLYKVSQFISDRVQINNAYVPYDIKTTNNVIVDNGSVNNVYGPHALHWWSLNDGTERSDVLHITRTVFNVGAVSGGVTDGIVWEGYCHTMRLGLGVGILNTRVGLKVNPTGSGSFYPAFLYAYNLEIDGTVSKAIEINAGSQMNFFGCDLFALSAAAGPVIDVLPDQGAGGSFTNGIRFIGCRMYGGQSEIFRFNAKNLVMEGCTAANGANAGVNSAPVVHLGSLAEGVRLVGNELGSIWGSSLNHSYGVIVEAGAQRVVADDNITYGCQTGDILDLSGTGTVDLGGGINRLGQPTKSFAGEFTIRAAKAGNVNVRVQNDAAGATQQAGLTLVTGTGNSFRSLTVIDNTGAPFVVDNGGSAITTAYHDVDVRIWRTLAGVEKARSDAAGFKLPAGSSFFVNNLAVVGARRTGWTAGSGTPNRGAFNADQTFTVSAAYTQAELIAIRDALIADRQRVLALEADLRAHGLIN